MTDAPKPPPPIYTREQVESAVKRALEYSANEYRRIACDELWCWEIEDHLRALASNPAAIAAIVEGGK